MNPHFTNDFTDPFQGMIPNYNPPVGETVENKNGPPNQRHQDTGFNSLISNVLNAGVFEGNHLYSDLDAIETPLDNNMELYDPLESNLITSQATIFPPSTIEQGVFNFEGPKLFNNSLGQIHQVPVPANNPILANQTLPDNMIQGSEGVELTSDVISPHQSVIHSMGTSVMNPVSVQSFYDATPAHTTQPAASAEESLEHVTNAEDSVNNGGANGNGDDVEHMGAELDLRRENCENFVEEPVEPAEDPLGDDNVNAGEETTDGVTSNGNENGEADAGEDGQLEKCVREGCSNTAVINPEWEDEYCSNECCVMHCKTVFSNWLEENLRTPATPVGN